MLEPRDLTDRQRRAWDRETTRLEKVSARRVRETFRPAPPDRPWWDDATSAPLDDLAREWDLA